MTMPLRFVSCLAAVAAAVLLLSGCGVSENGRANDPGGGNGNGDGATGTAGPWRIQSASFHDPLSAVASNRGIALRGARNETVDFAIQLNDFPEIKPKDKAEYSLRFSPLKLGASTITSQSYNAYQVLPMPVDTNQAAFVRHTGLPVGARQLPRALLPLAMENGSVPLSLFRNAAEPTNPAKRPDRGSSALVWVDVRVPPTVPPGQYAGTCELVDDGKAVASIPFNLTVHDFVIPDERHLLMVGLLDWDALARLYPKQFENVQPALLSRKDARHAGAVKALDDLVKLAQAHRTTVISPRLQPTVKWPAGKPVQIDWSDFDSLVTPWLKGDLFEDLVPLGYWPLPAIDNLDLYAASSRAEYWREAAAHFDSMDWLSRSSVAIERRSAGAVTAADAVMLSERAAQVLSVHGGIRVTVPLTEEQVLLATPQAPGRIPSDTLDRVLYSAPGLIAAPPLQRLPEGSGVRWLRTDLPGVMPLGGAGADEQEARLWSWLAFFRRAQLIQWPGVLPAQEGPSEAAGPEQLVWFYPGHWFGVDQPVPTLQLKWMRRAQQDYEYLWLARQRGQFARSLLLSRLMTRPVEIQPTQTPDAAYALLSGTSDPQAWVDALELATRTILVSQPGQAVDPQEEKQLIYRITAWSRTQERPMLLGKATGWYMRPDSGPTGSRWVDVTLDVDIYNAAELQPQRSGLQWKSAPEAWRVPREPVAVPQLGTYSVNRFVMNASVNLDRVRATSRQPVRVALTEGFSGRPYEMSLVMPVATAEQRLAAPPEVNGSLEDWFAEDALHEGHMVRMLCRPAIQQQQLPPASHPSAIYSTWNPTGLFLGFRVEGADAPLTNSGGNFIHYQLGRAWGEDICEVMMQPIYEDGSSGPLLYVALKPQGQIDVKRRSDPRMAANPWEALVSADVAYWRNLNKGVWRGELSIPWETINDFRHRGQRPVMLRFNFGQHRGRTGESSSWAGPVDYLRDEQFMGLLEIRAARQN